ncbi:hypothetical protein [Psychrobacillus sp. NPDC096623]|uniref:hypothetical protein n=1 Tax=Psychrobacillus sp. NPDC096623 TaxID=3364492 RepID=UPI00381EC3FC
MKVIYICLFTVLGLLILSGCTNQKVVNEPKQSVKTEEEVESDHVDVSENETYSVPFKISEINSKFANLNDSASDTPLTGVRYEVSLLSEKELSNEERMSLNFEVVTDSSILKESLGPIQPMILKDTTDGFIYFLVFETMYRDYTKDELEKLNKERNFQIFLNYEGVIKKVESL